MKTMNKILAILVIAIMAMAILLVPVKSLADTETATITLENKDHNLEGKSITIVRLFNIEEKDGVIYYSYPNDETKTYFENKPIYDTLEALRDKTNTEMQTLAEDFYNKNKTIDTVTGPKSLTEGADTIVFDGLTPGYYLIYDAEATDTTPRSAGILQHLKAGDNAKMTIKADAVTIEKTVENADKVSAEIGDELNFKITTKTPNTSGYTAENLTFKITDTIPTGLNYTANSIEVKIDGTAITLSADKCKVEDGNVTVDLGDYLLENNVENGKSVEISYKATVADDATNPAIMAGTATLEYSKDPSTASSKGTTTDVTTVYTYRLVIKKVDYTGSKILPGAKFTLTRANGSTLELTTNESGEIEIEGLKEGTYTLTETEAPTVDGVEYTKPKNPDFTFTIVAKTEGEGENQVIDYTQATLAFTESEGYIDTANKTLSSDTTTLVFNGQIKNARKQDLPETGGVGTVIFTVVGISIMAAAGFILVTRNRRSQED